MGYIKKLKNNELVGGTDKTTIYPVTSTEAVFEEITNGNESSFKSQKTINKEQQDELDDHEERIQAAEAEDIKSITINGSTKKFEVDDNNNVDLTIYTVDNDPEMPSIASNVEDLRNMVGTSTPVLGTSHKTRIETLEGDESVTGSVENKIKTKVDSINSSYQDDNNEYVKYSMTQTSGEVTNFNIDETSLKNAITSLNTSISGTNIIIVPQNQNLPSTGNAGTIYRKINAGNTYTDYMYSNGWKELATHDTSNEQAQVAYYTCTATGSGAQETKQFVGNGSLTYTPSSGGHIKILMGEANTATGTIYLQFGTTTSTKKPLYYNGEPASAENTWGEGETIAVYYDPSANSNAGAYFASNAQGSGKKELFYESCNIDDIPAINCFIFKDGNDYKWQNNYATSGGNWGKFLKIEGGKTYKITANASEKAYFAFLTDSSHVTGVVGNYAEGTTTYTVPANGSSVKTAPEDAKFLYFNTKNTSRNLHPESIVEVLEGNSLVDRQDAIIDTVNALKDKEEADVDGLESEMYNMTSSSEALEHSKIHNLDIGNTHYIITNSNTHAYLYYTEVSEGDYVNVNAVFPQARPIHIGVFKELCESEPSIQHYQGSSNVSSFNKTFKIEGDGYIAMYIFEDTGYTPTTFAFSKVTYTKPNDSRIDILEKNQLAETSPISISAYTEKTGLIGGSDNKTYYNLGKHIMIPVNEGDMLRIYANNSNMAFYAFMTGSTISSGNVPLVNGTVRKSIAAGSNKDIQIPATCTYLYVNKVDGNGYNTTPSAIYHLTSFQDVGDMIGAMEDVHYNNRQEEFMVKSLSRKLGGENEPKHIVIAQITDTHGTTSTVVKRFVEWVNKYMNEEVDVLVHTGDVQHLQWSDTEYVDYNSITGNSPMPVLIAPGNHDQCSFGNGNNELTAIYNRWILPLVNKGVLTVGETRAAGQVVEGDTYYYKDFTSKKIRMIMLNDFDPLYNGFYAQSAHSSLAYTKHRWSQNQINMLLQALTTVPSGYTVVVGRHARPSTTITDENWSVDTFPHYQTIDGNKVVVNNDQLTNGLPVNDILNAYATKSVMPATEYTWTDSLVTTAIGSLNVPETSFANAEGDLAFVMNGHDHVDFVGYYTSAPNVRVVTCGCGGHFTETYYMDVAREYNIGKGQDVINAYVIDTTNKKVWVVRIGANFTLNGKWRKVTSFNY